MVGLIIVLIKHIIILFMFRKWYILNENYTMFMELKMYIIGYQYIQTHVVKKTFNCKDNHFKNWKYNFQFKTYIILFLI